MRARNQADLESEGLVKKFVRYDEGANLYSMGLSKFKEVARDAHAVYKVGRIVLVNVEKLDDYLETYALN